MTHSLRNTSTLPSDVITLYTGLCDSFPIDVDATLKSIGDGVDAAATKLNTAFLNITGINIKEELVIIKNKPPRIVERKVVETVVDHTEVNRLTLLLT